MLFVGFILLGLAAVLIGIGFFGAAAMREGIVSDVVKEIGVVDGIGAGFLYGGGVSIFIGLIMGSLKMFGIM